ncbi:hypothetical protein N7453_009562 [Penicillium expansum]|nr:hypothetical protein N7453_009562 [Penicillium expansum]
MKVNKKNARGGKENLHSEPDKKLKNKRHRHMLLTISGIQKSEILMANRFVGVSLFSLTLKLATLTQVNNGPRYSRAVGMRNTTLGFD